MLTILSFFPIPPLAAGASAVNGILYMAADHDVFMGIVCLGGGVSMGVGQFAAYALGSGKYLALVLGQVAQQIQIYAGRITAGLGFVQGGKSSWDQANWIAEQEDANVLDYLGLIATIAGTELSAYFFGAGALWPEATSGKQVPLTEEGTGTEIVPYYPLNNGAIKGTEKLIYLEKGQIIDRYGKTSGKYFAPAGTPIEMRALPYGTDLSNYHQYEVIKPFEVESSIIAPAFDNIGLGTQYRSSVSVETLLKHGIIREVGGN